MASSPTSSPPLPLLPELGIDEKEVSRAALANLPDRGGKPERRAILTLNQEIRKLDHFGGVPGDWGYVALNIPVDDKRVLQLRFPDLISPDPETKRVAWLKFIRDPASAPYKVRRNDGKTNAQIRRDR